MALLLIFVQVHLEPPLARPAGEGPGVRAERRQPCSRPSSVFSTAEGKPTADFFLASQQELARPLVAPLLCALREPERERPDPAASKLRAARADRQYPRKPLVDEQWPVERDVELRATGVALPRATADQLPVDAARGVLLATDDVQAACFSASRTEHDVGAAARHIRCDRNGAAPARCCDDFRLAAILTRVEDGVSQAACRDGA